jgi:flagellar biosynthetic protein FliR
MPSLVDLAFGQLPLCTFLLVTARVAGLALGAPILSGVQVPLTTRTLLTLALSLVLTPTQLSSPASVPPQLADLAVMGAGEVLVGFAIGLGATIVLAALQMAGGVIAQMSGLSLAEAFDPDSGAATPILSQFLTIFAIVVFVICGGHRLLVEGLLESFVALPLGKATVGLELVSALVTLVGDGFGLALRVAAPGMASVLIATIGMAMLARSLPQLSMMSLGVGANVLAALGGLWISLGGIAWLLHDQLQSALEHLLDNMTS